METLKTFVNRKVVRVALVVGVAVAVLIAVTGCSSQEAIAGNFGTGWLGNQATRIAQCESGMNPSAVSPTNDYGLFQINAVHAGNFAAVTGTNFWSGWSNPYLNAQYARWLYNTSGGWGPWSCRYVL